MQLNAVLDVLNEKIEKFQPPLGSSYLFTLLFNKHFRGDLLMKILRRYGIHHKKMYLSAWFFMTYDKDLQKTGALKRVCISKNLNCFILVEFRYYL